MFFHFVNLKTLQKRAFSIFKTEKRFKKVVSMLKSSKTVQKRAFSFFKTEKRFKKVVSMLWTWKTIQKRTFLFCKYEENASRTCFFSFCKLKPASKTCFFIFFKIENYSKGGFHVVNLKTLQKRVFPFFKAEKRFKKVVSML